MRISDWSSDVCSSDLVEGVARAERDPDAALDADGRRLQLGEAVDRRAVGVGGDLHPVATGAVEVRDGIGAAAVADYEQVAPGPAGQAVRPLAAVQRVVAGTADQHVGVAARLPAIQQERKSQRLK